MRLSRSKPARDLGLVGGASALHPSLRFEQAMGNGAQQRSGPQEGSNTREGPRQNDGGNRKMSQFSELGFSQEQCFRHHLNANPPSLAPLS